MNIELSIVVNNHGVGLGEICVATHKLVKMDKTCKLMLQNEHTFMVSSNRLYMLLYILVILVLEQQMKLTFC